MADLMARRGAGHLLASFIGTAAAVLALLAAGSAQATTVTVAAMNYEFQPASRSVDVGQVVRWTFAGEPHTVTSRDGLFDSGVTDPGGSFEFRFDTVGTYRYYCQVHPEQMSGTIVVEAAASASPTVRPTTGATPRTTVRPTVRPTATPAPTLAPTLVPTPNPTLVPTPIPTPTPEPSESALSTPVASVTAGPSQALLETPLSSNVPASPSPGAAPSTNAIEPALIVALIVMLGALVGGGLLRARRRRVS